jgi:two-component system response regulator FlrC
MMRLYENLRGLKIALVEDDALLRDSLVLYFHSKGCVVSGFADAEAAIRSFKTDRPDIVISDYVMPGTDGMDLLRQVGVLHPAALRVLITGHPSPDLTREVTQAGIDEFILKPFSVEELEYALRRLMATRERKMSGTETRKSANPNGGRL